MNLNDSITVLNGLGSKKFEAFQNIGITKVEDLIRHLPRRYQDKRSPILISEVTNEKECYIEARVIKASNKGNPYGGKTFLVLLIQDDSGVLEVIYFNSKYLIRAFEIGEKYGFYGKITLRNNHLQLVQPDFNKIDEAYVRAGLVPIYKLTNGITQRDMLRFQTEASACYNQIEEWLPPSIIHNNKLCSLKYAYKNIHFPKDESAYKTAKFRIIFDELFVFQSSLALIKNNYSHKELGIQFKDDHIEEQLISNLTFNLTTGQYKVWNEINSDLCNKTAMNRLIQGDVGSGKTVIAQISMFKAFKEGYQSVMMAPTEILAKQHFDNFKELFKAYSIRIELLSGSLTKVQRNTILKKLASGEIDMLIGTHAILEKDVLFKNLGLVITDEQHRFGVNQRNLLSQKGEGVNVLVMTATPIPRTLGVVIYGDLDISIIDTMPTGRIPIITEAFKKNQRSIVYTKVLNEIKKGFQCYVVAPLIEDSELVDSSSADGIYQEINKLFAGFNVALIHGQMKEAEKNQIMNNFKAGTIDILVSTVVIEVGVNVPNASIMVIENSERFGLAQLHQLRGRVGRGNQQAFCYLISNSLTDIAKERTDTMTSTNDGFEIAERDLELRGPGDFFGTKQHGLPNLQHADIVKHFAVLQNIKPQVDEIMQNDPKLELTCNEGIKDKVVDYFGGDIKLSL